MNELTKTMTFVGVAVVVLATAIVSRPRPLENDQGVDEGELLCPDLTDPKVARSLEILDYDEPKSELRRFKVVQEKGVWRIPSHENYPADAEKQLGEAAASVFDLRKGPLISTDSTLHEAFGVVLPDPEKLSPGATGVGKRVTFADKDGKPLADFIIGKAVADRPELHYVRLPDKDAVYQVAIKTEKLSTRFDDWIEKDLLKINSLDIKQVAIDEYTVDEAAGAINQKSRIGLEYDSKQFKWNLTRLQTFAEKEPQDETLAEDEELNSSKLNEMKQALDDLKIFDVHRKPKGLSADLRASDEFQVSDNESAVSLMRRGFFPARDSRSPDSPITLYANEGDIRTSTTNGVEYVLRFGNIAGKGEREEGDDEGGAGAEKAEAGENRFVMITAEFNQDLIPLPELTPLDDESPSKDGGAESTVKDAGDGGGEGEASTADGPAGDAEGDPGADAEGDDEESLDEALEAAAQESLDEENDAAEETGSNGKPPAGSSSAAGDDSRTDEPSTATKKREPAGPKAAGGKPKLSTKEKIERDRIEKENKRKQDDYDKKVEDGRKLVKQLNARFADWYYIVSDATYKKIHLGRDDVIKKKDKPAADSNKDGKHDGHDHDTDDDDPGADLNLRKLEDLPDDEG